MKFLLESTLISIVGPTAVGKTALSLRIAEHFSTEIISADSRQMYRRLDIGTAKPTPQELSRVPHHLIGWLDPTEDLDAELFRQKAESTLSQVFARHPVAVVVGGSTLYMQALWFGLNDMPEIDPALRDKLNAEFAATGLEPLLEELQAGDPVTFDRIDRHNHVRVIRALEVLRATGTPISQFQQPDIAQNTPWRHLKIGLTDDREALYARINERVDLMIAAGLEREVKDLLDSGLKPYAQSMRSIGYQEMVAYLLGDYDRDEAIRLIKRNSRRYAKRQLTWYRRYEDIRWFEAGQVENVMAWLDEEMRLY